MLSHIINLDIKKQAQCPYLIFSHFKTASYSFVEEILESAFELLKALHCKDKTRSSRDSLK